MKISINQLRDTLTEMEQKWLNALNAKRPPRPSLANGFSQFFAMEMPCSQCGAGGTAATSGAASPVTDVCNVCGADPSRAPVTLDGDFLIFCIGINYDQGLEYTPYLHGRSVRRSAWVVDNSWRVVRRALNAALQSYQQDSATWHSNGYASASAVVPASWQGPPYRFTLAMTNLSPFVSLQPWSQYSSAAQKKALKSWNPNEHLCDLIQRLGNEVDLWVIHGQNHVWPTFSGNLNRWILTPQLGGQNLNSGRFGKFHDSPRKRPVAPRQPWPACATSVGNQSADSL